MNIQEIVQAYIIKVTASESEKELARLRLEVCDNCEFKHKSLVGVYLCKKCGCALEGKAFTPLGDRCPEGKWKEVESEFFHRTNKSTKNRIKLM